MLAIPHACVVCAPSQAPPPHTYTVLSAWDSAPFPSLFLIDICTLFFLPGPILQATHSTKIFLKLPAGSSPPLPTSQHRFSEAFFVEDAEPFFSCIGIECISIPLLDCTVFKVGLCFWLLWEAAEATPARCSLTVIPHGVPVVERLQTPSQSSCSSASS